MAVRFENNGAINRTDMGGCNYAFVSGTGQDLRESGFVTQATPPKIHCKRFAISIT